MNMPAGWDNQRYHQGLIDYEEDGQFNRRWRHSTVYEVMKLHFPSVYDPDVVVQPYNIPPPQGGGEI
ncbi:hypothetical protein MKX03_018962 [Papaver bracteatum]|nr:hypothetical protein MKX03_018962 [Papaver bracteatum]